MSWGSSLPNFSRNVDLIVYRRFLTGLKTLVGMILGVGHICFVPGQFFSRLSIWTLADATHVIQTFSIISVTGWVGPQDVVTRKIVLEILVWSLSGLIHTPHCLKMWWQNVVGASLVGGQWSPPEAISAVSREIVFPHTCIEEMREPQELIRQIIW